MKTESHKKFALNILKEEMNDISKSRRMAFVFGCIKPDIDMFSYLRGFKTHPFYGHNWENSKRYIQILSEKIEQGKLGSFGLGLLVHYLCDAFTFTHNKGFSGGLKAHAVYEKRLHSFFFENKQSITMHCLTQGLSLSETIESIHRRYMELPNTVLKDIEFIKLSVGLAVAYWKKSVYAETSGEKRCCAARYASRP